MNTNSNTFARDSCVQFLYQCECEKIYYFSQSHVSSFLEHFAVDTASHKYFSKLVEGVFSQLTELDVLIAKYSKNWSISRMGITDRVVLRIAVWELTQGQEPRNAIINEAVELAKKYGTEHSGAFVNGILDALDINPSEPSGASTS